MSIAQTLLVYVAIPVGVAVIVAAVVFSGGRRHRRRYRPGRPYDFAPVWYISSPEQITDDGGVLSGRAPRPALTQAGGDAPDLWPGTSPHGRTGGASDRW